MSIYQISPDMLKVQISLKQRRWTFLIITWSYRQNYDHCKTDIHTQLWCWKPHLLHWPSCSAYSQKFISCNQITSFNSLSLASLRFIKSVFLRLFLIMAFTQTCFEISPLHSIVHLKCEKAGLFWLLAWLGVLFVSTLWDISFTSIS